MFTTKLALIASLYALEANAQSSSTSTDAADQEANLKKLWRERTSTITDPLVPYDAGVIAPTATESLMTGSYVTRANTNTGNYYFGLELTLETAEPGSTFCQYVRMLNQSEIKDGVYQSFNTCARLTVDESSMSSSGTQNNQNNNNSQNNNGDAPTSIDISQNYAWTTTNLYGETLLYYEHEDGKVVKDIHKIEKEETVQDAEQDGFPLFVLQEQTQTVFQEGDTYKFTSRNIRPFTSADSTFDLKTCMDIKFTGSWARFDADGNHIAGQTGAEQTLTVTDSASQLISTAIFGTILSLLW